MKSPKVQINEMRVRASGLKPEQARRLGEMVASRLADARLGNQSSQRIPSAYVPVGSSTGNSVEALADQIVAGLRNKLR